MIVVRRQADVDDALRRQRARNTLIRTVKTRLRGSGLDIRELANELAISNPGNPENGRIYIPYASAEVSLRRPVWEYLGYLEGHGSDDRDPELCVDANKIIAALGGRVRPAAQAGLQIPARVTDPVANGEEVLNTSNE